MLEERVEYKIDNIDIANKTISIAKDVVIKKDGSEIARNRHRCSFAPGDIEAVKVYLGVSESPEINYLNAIWTEQVISDYRASLDV